MIVLGDNKAADFARMAMVMAAIAEQTKPTIQVHNGLYSDLVEQKAFTISQQFEYPSIDHWQYNKDLPNLRKHRETCLKNRKKRKAKKRRK